MSEETRDFASDMCDITTAIKNGESLGAMHARKLFDLWAIAVRSAMLVAPEVQVAREWGLNPEEANPRGTTWLHERRNWETEVAQLRGAVKREYDRAEVNAERAIQAEEELSELLVGLRSQADAPIQELQYNADGRLEILQQRDQAIKQRDVARKERNLARAQLTAMKTELVAAREIARRRVKESRELLIDRDRAREFARRCWQALDGKVRAGCPDVPTWVEAQHDPLD